MERILLPLLSILMMRSYAEIGLDFCGTYRVRSTDVPIHAIIAIDKVAVNKRAIKIDVKDSPYGKMKCRNKNNGLSIIEDDGIMTTHLSCSGGIEYSRIANLNNVSTFQKFSAIVYSSLYETDIKMHYNRINRDGCHD